MTEDGQKRKDNCIERLFHERLKTRLTLNFYVAILPLLKQYVMLFEMKDPIVHLLHEKQVQLFKEFLVCFCKPEKVKCMRSRDLVNLDLKVTGLVLDAKDMFIGGKNAAIVSKSQKSYVIENFLATVHTAYTTTADYLRHKLPLNNPLLRSISAIDPTLLGNQVSVKYLSKLPEFITNVLTVDSDLDKFQLEVRKIQIDSNSAIQSVKYAMRVKSKTASQLFYRKNKLYDPIRKDLSNNFRSSSKIYRNDLELKRKEVESRKRKMNIVEHACLSKKKAKEVLRKKAEKERLSME